MILINKLTTNASDHQLTTKDKELEITTKDQNQFRPLIVYIKPDATKALECYRLAMALPKLINRISTKLLLTYKSIALEVVVLWRQVSSTRPMM